ncbi:LOW QUALITY PROTEIN: olfactory receptor 8B4-like [Papio anubis]|uniref:LOW QUALITY PROTEIN: olfactory receptor 8B4-like n=1 Tax=Papio anubis TaxID=9555 RepID=UPI0012AD674E|nr:LOW QUALITY PROTEIN: olfactory receptor 8B4-like [Papio anubis]
MVPGNDSFMTQIILLGLAEQPDLQLPLFFRFLVMCMVTVLGNLGLVTLIVLNSYLHTPKYFFLFNLSFIDLCYSSAFTPKMLMDFITEKDIISYMGCMSQLFFFFLFDVSECYVLTSMAYDHYHRDHHVAICNPFLYSIAMSPKVYYHLMLGFYLLAFSSAMAHTGCMLRLTFCDANTIDPYLCDILPLLQLSRTGTYIKELVASIAVAIIFHCHHIYLFFYFYFLIFLIFRDGVSFWCIDINLISELWMPKSLNFSSVDFMGRYTSNYND